MNIRIIGHGGQVLHVAQKEVSMQAVEEVVRVGSLALMKESPLRPLRNESRDYWRRLWVEFSDVAFPDAL